MSFQMTCGGEIPPASYYRYYLIEFIANFGMVELLGREEITFWLTIIPTSATDQVKYASYWGMRSLQNHSNETTYFTDG